MNNELLAQVEREVLGWPGVWKKRDEDGVGGIGVSGYRYGDPETGGPQIGHIHDNAHADFRFPREVRDELIRSGRAIPHPAFPNSRTTVSYMIRNKEDVAGAVELFRMNYERIKNPLDGGPFGARSEAGRDQSREKPRFWLSARRRADVIRHQRTTGRLSLRSAPINSSLARRWSCTNFCGVSAIHWFKDMSAKWSLRNISRKRSGPSPVFWM